MGSFINKFTYKYTCFCNLFNARGLVETKDDYFKGGVLKKRLRTTVLKCRHKMEKSFVRNIKYYSQRSVWSIFSLERQPNTHEIETWEID